MRSKHLALIMGILIAVSVQGVAAQDNYVDQIVAENASLGADCNPIGLAVEGQTAPVAPTQEWINEHTACTQSGIRTAAQCQGALSGDRRYELCAFIVVSGDEAVSVDCHDFQMYSDLGLYGPDEQMTV